MFKLPGFCLAFVVAILAQFQGFAQLTANKDTVQWEVDDGPVLKKSTHIGLYHPTLDYLAYNLVEGQTFSYRGTNTYYPMAGFTTTQYTQGYLQAYHHVNGNSFVMNYRLLKPVGYDANYAAGYPMIVMLPGAGERGNCWGAGNCYYSDLNYNPNTVPTSPPVTLLNNDHNLMHGGQPHLTAVNLAGTKKAGDPTLPPRAFPGFVLFPQNLNGWVGTGGAGSPIENAVRIIRLLVEKYNIDPDRIYVHGLSNGGFGTYAMLNAADWLFAAAAPMSAAGVGTNFDGGSGQFNFNDYDSAINVPIWTFQGGTDQGPAPYQTEALIRGFQAAGGSVRYTKYANLGHGVWNTAYAEPDFFSWLLSHTKRNIFVYNNNPNICSTTGAGARMELAQGFHAYQWEFNGQLISGATSHRYTAFQPGVYRARFSRKPNPTESDWNGWSDPVTVGEQSPLTASMHQVGTVRLAGPGNFSTSQPFNGNPVIGIQLKSDHKADHYYWYRNGVLFDNPLSTNINSDDTVSALVIPNNPAYSGTYTLKTAGFDNCESFASEPKYVSLGNNTQNNTPAATLPPIAGDPTSLMNVTGTITSPTSVMVKWNDASNLERNYEVWRRRQSYPVTDWEFLGLVDEDVTMFHDTTVQQHIGVGYAVRAVSNTGSSLFMSPGGGNLIKMPGTDVIPPTAPGNLVVTVSGYNRLALTWDASTDNARVREYEIYYRWDLTQPLQSIRTTATTYEMSGLLSEKMYFITVKAIDYSDNFSAPSNEVAGSTYRTGVGYSYSTGAWTDIDDPTILWSTPEMTGVVPNFNNAAIATIRTQEDFFMIQFDGILNVPTTGTYTFYMNSDDGSRLWIDEVQRIDFDGLHGLCSAAGGNCPNNWGRPSSALTLSAGPHSIRVRMFEYTGGQEIFVRWSGPAGSGITAGEQIPDAALRSPTNYVPPTPPPAPQNLAASGTSMTQTSVSWTYPGAANTAKKIVILGSSTAAETPGPTAGNGFVSLLTNWITSISPTSSVTNLAVGGFDTRDVMPTGTGSPATPDDTHNITYALSLNPDIIIVNLPSNDVVNSIDATETLNNLIQLRTSASAQNVQLFVTTTQPREIGNTPTALTSAQKLLLQTEANSILTTFGGFAINIYEGLSDFSGNTPFAGLGNGDIKIAPAYRHSDGIHLNNAGHAFIFEQVKQKLLPYFTSFEVHRATSAAGPYSIVSRLNQLSLTDINLVPNKTYYYKVRTANQNGLSATFAGPVSATTLPDAVAPTAPTVLATGAINYNAIALTWNFSTDNVKVTNYRVYVTNTTTGSNITHTMDAAATQDKEGYVVSGLLEANGYSFKVSALDASGNESGFSNTVNASTTGASILYSKSGGNLNSPATWGPNADGSGTSPSSFDVNGQYYVVSNRTTSSLGGSWTVNGTLSKVIVPDGVTLTVDNTFSAKVDVQGTGTLVLSNATIPEIGTLSPQSTVRYTTPLFIEPKEYGNIELAGSGYKTFPEGTTTVHGNITTGTGVAMRGWSDNGSTVTLEGDLNVTGLQAETPLDFALKLNFAKNGTQTLTSATPVTLFSLGAAATTTVNLANGGTPFDLKLGSPNPGGGLSLATGSTLNIGNNRLFVSELGGINTAGETGKIAVNGGDITLSGAKTVNSHLYFPVAPNNVANRLVLGLTSSGDAVVHSNMSITDGLKLTGSGDLTSGGFVTLVSDASKTANLERIEGAGRVLGDVTVQRYIAPKGVIYRYISTPVAATSVADWQAFVPITGNFTGHSPQSTSPSMYYYDEANGGYKPFPPPLTSNAELLQRGVGYFVYFRNGASPVTMSVPGVPYQGNVPFTLTPDPTPSGSSADGWNLVGNPYASTISWANAGWTKTGIHNTVSVKDNPSGVFRTWMYNPGNGFSFGDPELQDGKIAPGQAFWVQTLTVNPALTITEAAKVAAQGTMLRTRPYEPSYFVANLTRNDITDRAYIVLTETGGINFDEITDTPKRLNDKFSFASISADGLKLVMNDIGVEFCQTEVRFSFTNPTVGDYHLTFGNIDQVQDIQSVELIDQFTGTSMVVDGQTDYTFTVTTDVASFGDNRFKLRLTRPAIESISSLAAAEVCGEGTVALTINGTETSAEYMVMKGDVSLSEYVQATGNQLTIQVPGTALSQGENTFKIKGRYNGCEESLFTQTASLNYFPSPAVSVTDQFTICVGSSVSIVASGAPAGGRYNWYNGDGSLSDVTGNTFEIPMVKNNDILHVAAVNSNGCEGDQKLITIQSVILEKPSVELVDDTFYVMTDASATIQWTLNGEPIEGATGNSFKPEASGIYNATVDLSVCSEESAPIEYVTTGLMEEAGSSLKVMVYPNPVKSEDVNIRVSGPDQGPVAVSITDVLQRKQFTNEYNYSEANQGVALPIRDRLVPGMYFIVVQQGSQKVVRKVTVQ